MKKTLINPLAITILLFLQLIPLVMFPLETFNGSTQEWWLPLLLGILSLIGAIQIAVFNSLAPTPWYLISFAQGFNIISRLMMILPGSSTMVGKELVFDIPYVAINIAAMILSALCLWYFGMPEVQHAMIRIKKAH